MPAILPVQLGGDRLAQSFSRTTMVEIVGHLVFTQGTTEEKTLEYITLQRLQ